MDYATGAVDDSTENRRQNQDRKRRKSKATMKRNTAVMTNVEPDDSNIDVQFEEPSLGSANDEVLNPTKDEQMKHQSDSKVRKVSQQFMSQ